MSDEPTDPTTDLTPDPDPTPTPAPDPTDEVAKWKAMARKHEAEAKALRPAAQRLQELEEQGRTEAEKLAAAKAAAEKEAADARDELSRLRVATSKGLSPDLAARLVGTTEEELAEDADRLLALMKPATPAPPTPGSADAGPRGDTPTTPTLAEQIAAAEAAGDHRKAIALKTRTMTFGSPT